MREKSSAKALEYLKDLMVDVRLGVTLKEYKDKYATFADGRKEYWETLIWTAGVKGEPIPESLRNVSKGEVDSMWISSTVSLASTT